MTLQIELPAAVESALLARAAAEGKDVSTFVVEAVTERLAAPSTEVKEPRPPMTSQNFAQRIQAWADLHPRTGRVVDDSRESIYSGRGQ